MSSNSSEYHREWRRKNPEKVKAISKRYRNSEKNQKRRRTPEFLKRNREYSKSFRRENPEKVKEWNKKWRKNNGSLKQGWFKKIVQRDGRKCIECGATENLTLNHKIPKCVGGKYSYENLEIMCSPCNAKTFHQLVKKALRLYFNNK